jgi:hypothetical protein
MAALDYLDCELYLTDYDQAKLTVAGRDYSGRPVLSEARQRELLEAAPDPIQYGTKLFETAFPDDDDLLNGYRAGVEIMRREKKLLRFRLRIAANAPPALHALHWELLYDSKTKIALSRSREIAFSRYSDVPFEPGTPVKVKPKLLVVLSSPKNLADYNLPQIDIEVTKRSIDEALTPLADLIEYEFLEGPATAANLLDHLTEGGFHALHIQAHGLMQSGRGSASLVLEKEDGQADFIDEEIFSDIFVGERDLRLVTLIACHGGAQSNADPFSGLGLALVQRGIPAVVAMRKAISISAAASFSKYFYRNLARSGQVDKAANDARQQLFVIASNRLEWSTPAVFMRLADGRLWEAGAEAETRARQAPRSSDFDEFWSTLMMLIESGQVVPFLGPGMYESLLPSGAKIAELWAEKYKYPILYGRNELPRVAQFMTKPESPRYPHDQLLRDLVKELLAREGIKDAEQFRHLTLTQAIEKFAARHFDQDENESHWILAKLPISTYITTNYDSFMTAALKSVGKNPQREYCFWRSDREEDQHYKNLKGSREAPLVFHLYGNDEHPLSLVLTEDDYLDFLRVIAKDDWRIPQQVQATLTESMLLFLGYRPRDLDCRVLFRGLLAQMKDRGRGRIAVVQINPEDSHKSLVDELRNFMKRCCEELHIRVYEGSVRDFLIQLRRRWEANYGSF